MKHRTMQPTFKPRIIDMVDITTLAFHMGVKPCAVIRKCEKREIPFYVIDGEYRFSLAEVEQSKNINQ